MSNGVHFFSLLQLCFHCELTLAVDLFDISSSPHFALTRQLAFEHNRDSENERGGLFLEAAVFARQISSTCKMCKFVSKVKHTHTVDEID